MTYRCFTLLIGVCVAVLAGCATPPPAQLPPPARQVLPLPDNTPLAAPPAQVQPMPPESSDTSASPDDQTQEPPVAAVPWKQRGLASWYGKRFNGRRTASGERFSASGFTAAHRTLPIPSYVRVRRVASGEEVIVRINDRGPFHSARVLDLSYAAANQLGIVALGSAEVEMELLTEEEWRASGNSTTPGALRR